MPKLPPGQLSKHPTKGYRLTCGWYVKDGVRRPKVFWLGKDLARATVEAQKIRWSAPIAAVAGGWTKEYEQQVRGIDTIALVRQRFQEAEQLRQTLTPHLAPGVVVQLPPPPPASPPPSSSPPHAPAAPPGTPMLHAALDAFVEATQLRALSWSHKKTIGDSIAAIKQYQADCPLAGVDYAWLEALTSHIKARPASRRRCRRTGQYEPIRPYTVRRLLQHARMAVQWLHKQHGSTRFGGWRAPAEWRELFHVQLTRLMSKGERDKAADGPEQLTVEEIVRLFRAARAGRPPLHPILFLMGLFTAQGQSELACTRRDEIDLGRATFTHRRNKTGQKGVYWLPPELVKMLRTYFGNRPGAADELAFRTREGEPLVTPRSDSVRQAWDDWRARAKVGSPGIGFYGLRRFFGDYATRKGGDAAGDAALAHTPKSVRTKHYSGFRDFDAVGRIGRELHAELKAAGLFKADPKSK